MKLKCIGGPNDGEWHEVRDDSRLNDHVCVSNTSRLKLTSILDFDNGLPKSVKIDVNYYIVKCLRYSDCREFKFLIPEGEDEFCCIVNQLKAKSMDTDKLNKMFEIRFGINFNEWFKIHQPIMEKLK